MLQVLQEVVNKYRKNGIQVTDEEAETVCQHCYRKMEVAGVRNPEEYLPWLYEDELKNYVIRGAINTAARLLNKVLEVI